MTEDDRTPSPQRRRSGRDAGFEVALGARIREARIAARMTQRALGSAVGINYQKLQKYELGKDRIAVSTLQRIARALQIHPGALFDDPMPKETEAAPDTMLARKALELAQVLPDPNVIERLLAVVIEVGKSGLGWKSRRLVRSASPSAERPPAEQVHSDPVGPMQAVVDPLLKMLRQTGEGDAGAMARLLGQALAEAEKIVKA